MMPVALAFPLHVGVLGLPSALKCLPVVILLGWIFVDITISGWRRIPFTCTFLFGKRPPAFTLLFAFLAFIAFVSVGTNLQQLASSGSTSWLIVVGVLSLISAGLWWYRLQGWGRCPLEFEDYLPNSLETLRL